MKELAKKSYVDNLSNLSLGDIESEGSDVFNAFVNVIMTYKKPLNGKHICGTFSYMTLYSFEGFCHDFQTGFATFIIHSYDDRKAFHIYLQNGKLFYKYLY